MVRELTLELENKIVLVNVELKLIRKIPRWDLRNPSIYSNAVVYDCTARARGNLYQILHFHLRNEFQSRFLFIPNYLRDNTFLAVEKVLMNLKMLQYVNPRYGPIANHDQYASGHPDSLEPSFQCSNQTCASCRAVSMCRQWTNACYHAQHRVSTEAEVQGIETVVKPLYKSDF